MRRDIRFKNAEGTELYGRIELPPGRPRAVALFAHCFTCTIASHGARRIAMALAEHGIATMAFDFTGLGKSGGAFADSHFAANVSDLVAAAAYLRAEFAAAGILLDDMVGFAPRPGGGFMTIGSLAVNYAASGGFAAGGR